MTGSHWLRRFHYYYCVRNVHVPSNNLRIGCNRMSCRICAQVRFSHQPTLHNLRIPPQMFPALLTPQTVQRFQCGSSERIKNFQVVPFFLSGCFHSKVLRATSQPLTKAHYTASVLLHTKQLPMHGATHPQKPRLHHGGLAATTTQVTDPTKHVLRQMSPSCADAQGHLSSGFISSKKSYGFAFGRVKRHCQHVLVTAILFKLRHVANQSIGPTPTTR